LPESNFTQQEDLTMKQIVLGSIMVLTFATLARAQHGTTDTIEYRYPTEIIVTAPRLSMPVKDAPFSTSVVGHDIIGEIPRSVAADEAFKLVPGVKVDNQSNSERVHLSIRGQGILTERGIRGIKILLDGIPINDPTGFAPDFFDVDFSAVDHIEVLRGPAASLYGGSASGGIINIMTQPAVNKPLYGDAEISYGSNNFWKGFGQFGGDVDNVNYNVSFSRTMGDGYRVHTHFWGNNLYGKATYAPADGIQLTPIFGYTHVYHENPEGINLDYYNRDPKLPNDDAVPFNEYLETERVTNGVKGHFALAEQHEFDVLAFVKRTLFTEANNKTFSHRTIVTPGASAEYDYSAGRAEDVIRNRAGVGADLQWQTIDLSEFPNDHAVELPTLLTNERIKQRGVGIFVVDKLSIGKRWNIVGSLRYDNIHNELKDFLMSGGVDASGNADFSKATGRIGATYDLMPEANLFANWGQGFLPPATEELAQNPDQFGGFNTHLTSATSQGFEAGTRGSLRQDLSYDATFFTMTTDNDFDRYRVIGRGVQTFYRNSGSTRRSGAELYGRYTPIRELEFQLAYTYSNFKYTSNSPTQIVMDDTSIVKFIKSGNWLPNSPQHQLYFDAQYAVVPQLSLAFSVEALSKAYIDGANVESEAVSGYVLLHARVVFKWEIGTLLGEFSLNVRNIGDIKYVAFSEPDPGGNAYQPGAGREFFGGLKIRL
jgi:iron complex outermembrane receptor protein